MPTPSSRQKRLLALERQVERLDRRLSVLRARAERLSWTRLLIFVAGFILSGVLFFWRGPSLWLPATVVWLVIFAIFVAYHRRVDAAVQRHAIWRDIKRAHIARMSLNWTRLPPPAPLPPVAPTHPFALDLDLSGDRSLHHLLDTTATYDGSLRLRRRLLEQAPSRSQIAQRQALTRALRPLPLFRDRLALHAILARGGEEEPWRADALLAWVNAAPDQDGISLRRLLTILIPFGLLNLLLLLLAQTGSVPAIWPLGIVIYFALYLGRGRAATRLFNDALSLQDAMQQMAIVFRFLERDRYNRVVPLRQILSPFRTRGEAPSNLLRALARVVAAAGLSRNAVLWLVLNIFFPWDLFFAFRLHRLRSRIAARLEQWLAVWFELEVASAFANQAYLNPAYTFPHINAPQQGPPFEARQMGHPLIAPDVRVRNDYTLAAPGDVHIITGSNMAGKSSFLRTVGVNVCLAYAGGAVDAASLSTDRFRLFTAIRISDSVTDGISYFYAEVKRLKALLDALQDDHDQPPLLFLIDEIFRGTNNRERLLGSRAYIRSLVGQNGVGLIATHDLELVQLAHEMSQVANYHFRDSVSDGRMIFDYRLRPGPSPTTNALKLMAQAGLPVPPSEDEQP